MVKDFVPDKWMGHFNEGLQSLVPIYHSYVREGKPHIYILRMEQLGSFTYHAISCVHNLMSYTFGYVNFCDKCHRVTYLKNNVHKYCKVVTPGMQHNSAYHFWPSTLQEKQEWRHHPANIQTAINSVVGTNGVSHV